MKATPPLLTETFLLESDLAVEFFEGFARDLPIIDYHNHLSPRDIAEDRRFASITELWLAGDHYKWRALRANGVNEHFITGGASDWEKFEKWAETVPMTLRNPLFHWTHLELWRYFDIREMLSPRNARTVYERCNALLNEDGFSARGLLRRMRVEWLGTTDDPCDDLRWHRQLAEERPGFRVLPTFRPDGALLIERADFPQYLQRLGQAAEIEIHSLDALKQALENRLDHFHACGCRLADHGLEQLPPEDATERQAEALLQKRLQGRSLSREEALRYRACLLQFLGEAYHARGWVQQFHLGALRNPNSRLFARLGADAGTDCIGDFPQALGLTRFLDRLDRHDRLPKTILYNLNPADNALFATIAGSFNDGSAPGKVQYGAAWWFLDTLDGMRRQLDTLSDTGLLSRFVGMLTDSRSFLSFPRHEYFRRLLCNLLAQDALRGRLPRDKDLLGDLIKRVCYINAREYFG